MSECICKESKTDLFRAEDEEEEEVSDDEEMECGAGVAMVADPTQIQAGVAVRTDPAAAGTDVAVRADHDAVHTVNSGPPVLGEQRVRTGRLEPTGSSLDCLAADENLARGWPGAEK